MTSKLKIALITWEDAYSISKGWDDKESIIEHLENEDLCIYQVGYILSKNKDCYTVAAKRNPTCEGEKFSEVTRIPRGCVRKIEYLTTS